MSVATDNSGFDRDEFEDKLESKMIRGAEYSNVIASAIMSVLVGGILLALGVVIIDDFLSIIPETDAFMDSSEVADPLSTAFGLAAIALVVPIVGAVVAVLMGSFGGMLGGNGGGRTRR